MTVEAGSLEEASLEEASLEEAAARWADAEEGAVIAPFVATSPAA